MGACMCTIQIFTTPKLSDLKLKTRPKQLLGSLPLAFSLPVLSVVGVSVVRLSVVAHTVSKTFFFSFLGNRKIKVPIFIRSQRQFAS